MTCFVIRGFILRRTAFVPTAAKDIRKIAWAVDPFEKDPVGFNCVQKLFQSFLQATHAVIEPVYVLNPAAFSASLESEPGWVEQYRPAARRALQELTEEFRGNLPLACRDRLLSPKILLQESASHRLSVKTLAQYAESSLAQLLVVGARGLSGMSRLMGGSFSESLIIHSAVPLLVIEKERAEDLERTGKSLEDCVPFKKILFPTDLGESCRNYFEQTVRLAAMFKASVTLFHSIPNSVETAIHNGMFLFGGAWAPVSSYFREDTDKREKKLEAMSEWANRRGVKCDWILDESGANVPIAILQLTERFHYDLISLASQSDPRVAAFIGSIARQVVRHSRKPVWILPPPERTRKKAEARRKAA